jgi:RNA polymerase sigma-70 factor (sigma-E family)
MDDIAMREELTHDGAHAGREPGPLDFDAFIAARSERLLRTGYLLTGDWGLAEDLVQVALVKAWRRWPRVEHPDAYVLATMTRTYRTWWRRKWHGEVPTQVLPDVPTADDDVDVQTDVWAALAQLSRQQRAVLVLRYFVDLTEVDTAEVLDCSVGTVKAHTSRALAKLRLNPGLSVTREQGGDPR